MIDQGATAAQVAERFGVEESLVLKRMKLARVAPQLLKEYRSDGMTLECLMAFTLTDDHQRQMKAFKSLQDWQKSDPSAIRACLTEQMIEADSKLARFVGLDAYQAAGGVSRADLFGNEVYLENPDLLNQLAQEKLEAIRKQMEEEGWGWVEINRERDWDAINRCDRIRPQLIAAPADLLALKAQLDAELAEVEQALEDTESDNLLDQREAIHGRLEEVEQRLTAFIDFDSRHKALAGCYVSISHDGTLCFDKGLVKPEHRKLLAKLLKTDDDESERDQVKPKNLLSESLRRDLAVYRLQAAQVEIARHPAIALDLLAFKAATSLLDHRPISHGPDILFRRRNATATGQKKPTAADHAMRAIEQGLASEWRKRKSEADRFNAFRALPDAGKLEWLAYCVALTLQPKLAATQGQPATAYDAALALTEGSVAAYWRPSKDNYLARITHD